MKKKILVVLLVLTMVLAFSFTALADTDKSKLQDLNNYVVANFASYTNFDLIFLSDMIDWTYTYVPNVLKNANATQELVNSTYNDFLKLIKSGTGSYPPGFEPIVEPEPVDKTALNTAIAEAKAIIDSGLGKYTDTSVLFFVSYYSDAITVRDNANATQQQVDKAVADLNKSIANLVLVPVSVYHIVTFVDYDGTKLDEQQVKDGAAAIAPANPQREGYTFTGWDVDFSAVGEALTVTAQYEINVYTVGFRVFDGYWNIGYLQQVEHGASINWALVEENYTFYGGKTLADVELWCKDPSGNPLWNLNEPVTEDLVLFPKFHAYELTITATCWAGGWDKMVCTDCGETDGKTYGWRGALGHDYTVTQHTEATCWAGGGDYVKCERCGHEELINWVGALGHSLGAPQAIEGNDKWDIVYCQREGCDYSQYVAKEVKPNVVESAVPTASVKKLNGNKNDLTITITETYTDGKTNVITSTISISNNAAGTYNVGGYKVYVDTKGNDQIRACYLVE